MAIIDQSKPRDHGGIQASPSNAPDIAERSRDSQEWEYISRKSYRGGAFPSIIYDFKPPFLFDCRLKTDRRMGIGDQLCLLSAIQGVGDKIGQNNILIWYDKSYPASTSVFGMSGIESIHADESANYPTGHTAIPCRGHIFDSIIGSPHQALYAEQEGCPVSGIYWNWGWHKLFRGYPVRLKLFPTRGDIKQAQGIARQHAPYVTVTPLEVSRHNNDCTIDVWHERLRGVDKSLTILFGTGDKEKPQLEAIIGGMYLPHKTAIISTQLPAWKALVDMAAENYTGNNCGMWLAFASKTKTYLLQHDDGDHLHNQMWNYKAKWNCRNIVLIKI